MDHIPSHANPVEPPLGAAWSPSPLSVDVKPATARTVAQLETALAELLRAVNSALHDERDAAEDSIRRVAAIMEVGVLAEDAFVPAESVRGAGRPGHSGLAPWQIRQVKTHIASNLSATIRTQDLANIAGLSPFHFSRAFRDSFGDSPHSYLLHRRVERSQGLMLTTNTSLAEIALDCGLVDQAHFGKLFRRLVGESPGAWRRARTIQAA